MTHSTDPEAWIRRFHPNPDAGIRLICLPHAGGSAPFYFPVSRALAPEIEVLAVQYPGRMDRRKEPLIGSIDTLAEVLFEVLEPVLDDKPYALFGHSMGATVAFELARRFEAIGKRPRHLFASGRRAPSRQLQETVHQRDDAGLIADLKKLSGTDAKIFGNEELLASILPAIRGDYKAAETYEFRAGPALLRTPITALIGDQDPKVDRASAEAWGVHTTGDFELLVYPGGHFYLAEQAPAVLQVISERLSPYAAAAPVLAGAAGGAR